MEWESDSPCRNHMYPVRDADPLKCAAAGSWSLGIVQQSQDEGCCWLWRGGSRGCEGENCGGTCLWRKARQPRKPGDTAESHVGGGAITIASLPTRQHQQLNNREAGPSNTWCTELQSKTPPRVPLYVADAPIYRVGPQWGEKDF